jgi:signal transduction histidine kinase
MIFDPFYTRSPVGKGTGLGLSICYSIIQQHHGRIEVESEVGIGTCFRVHLPLA